MFNKQELSVMSMLEINREGHNTIDSCRFNSEMTTGFNDWKWFDIFNE